MLVRLASSHRRLISLPRHRSRQVHRTLPGGVCKLTSLALWVAYHHSGAANHSTSMQKRQNGQPHSTTLARGSHTPRYWRSFWSAPVFSGAFPSIHPFRHCIANRDRGDTKYGIGKSGAWPPLSRKSLLVVSWKSYARPQERKNGELTSQSLSSKNKWWSVAGRQIFEPSLAAAVPASRLPILCNHGEYEKHHDASGYRGRKRDASR